jgi:Flp pilus assembly pilin Flp
MAKFFAATKRFWTQQAGANLVEYGILIGLIAVVCFKAVSVIGQMVKAMFNVSGPGL